MTARTLSQPHVPPNPELAALPDLFLFNPANRAYVDGQSQPYVGYIGWSPGFTFCLALTLFLLTTITCFVLMTTPSEAAHYFILPALTFLVALGFHWRAARIRRVASEGRLLIGTVTDSRAEKKSDEDGEYFKVFLWYQFRTPNGRLLWGKKATWVPPETIKYFRPNVGTPLAVLYMNDNLYEVL